MSAKVRRCASGVQRLDVDLVGTLDDELLARGDVGAHQQLEDLVDVLDELFAVLVRDFSAYAVELHGKDSATEAQQAWALGAVRRPVVDEARSARVWERVEALAGAYELAP